MNKGVWTEPPVPSQPSPHHPVPPAPQLPPAAVCRHSELLRGCCYPPPHGHHSRALIPALASSQKTHSGPIFMSSGCGTDRHPPHRPPQQPGSRLSLLSPPRPATAVALLAISNTLLTCTWVPAGTKREQIRLWSRNKAAELRPAMYLHIERIFQKSLGQEG